MSEFARRNYPNEYPQIRKLKNEVIRYSGLDFEKTRDAYSNLLNYISNIDTSEGINMIGTFFMNITHKYLNAHGEHLPIM